MNTHQRARTLAIQIQIPDVKLLARAMKLRLVRTVYSASETILRVIRNLQSVVVVVSLDHSQHGAEDLFLLDRRAGFHIRDHGRLDKESLLAARPAASQHPPAFTLSFFDVRVDRLERLLVDDGAHVSP